jgi:hypothetical protein
MLLLGFALGYAATHFAFWIRSRAQSRREDKRWKEVRALELGTIGHPERIRTRHSVHNEGVSVMRKARVIKRRKV